MSVTTISIFIFFVGRSRVTVYIDIKRHVCARVVIMFSQVAARALRIQVQVYTGHFVGGLTRRQSMASGRVVFVLFLQQRPGARGKITILTSTPEATMLSREKIQAWFTFLFFHL